MSPEVVVLVFFFKSFLFLLDFLSNCNRWEALSHSLALKTPAQRKKQNPPSTGPQPWKVRGLAREASEKVLNATPKGKRKALGARKKSFPTATIIMAVGWPHVLPQLLLSDSLSM